MSAFIDFNLFGQDGANTLGKIEEKHLSTWPPLRSSALCSAELRVISIPPGSNAPLAQLAEQVTLKRDFCLGKCLFPTIFDTTNADD